MYFMSSCLKYMYFMSSCLKNMSQCLKNVFMSFMQTFAQSNCMFTSHSDTDI